MHLFGILHGLCSEKDRRGEDEIFKISGMKTCMNVFATGVNLRPKLMMPTVQNKCDVGRPYV
jgi:hypothetical protein